jgi:hypothetical protein
VGGSRRTKRLKSSSPKSPVSQAEAGSPCASSSDYRTLSGFTKQFVIVGSGEYASSFETTTREIENTEEAKSGGDSGSGKD